MTFYTLTNLPLSEKVILENILTLTHRFECNYYNLLLLLLNICNDFFFKGMKKKRNNAKSLCQSTKDSKVSFSRKKSILI